MPTRIHFIRTLLCELQQIKERLNSLRDQSKRAELDGYALMKLEDAVAELATLMGFLKDQINRYEWFVEEVEE